MKVFSIQEDRVQACDSRHRYGNLAFEWPIDDFESQFGHEFPNDMIILHYEPERNIYFIGSDYDNPMHVTEPDADVHIKWVHDNFEDIMFQIAEVTKGVDYSYDPGQDQFIITPERQAIIEKRNRQMSRMEKLSGALVAEFEMILAMFEVGRDKGIWKATDFPAELREKVADWKQTIADYKAEENS